MSFSTSSLMNVSLVQEKISLQMDILDTILPIINITQGKYILSFCLFFNLCIKYFLYVYVSSLYLESLFGPGSGCYGDSTTPISNPTVHTIDDLTSKIATDVDREEERMGLAVVSVNDGSGVWQYRRNNELSKC